MKKLIIVCVIFILTGISLGLHSLPAEEKRSVFIIGICHDLEQAAKMHMETGMVMVEPLNFNEGLSYLAKLGHVCNSYGHSYENGECKFCLKKEESEKGE